MSVVETVMSCDAVVFDCGDTLLRLDPSREVIFRDAASEIGVELRLADVAFAYECVDFAIKVKSSELTTGCAKSEFYHAFNEALCGALGIHRSFAQLHPLLTERFKARRKWVPFEDAAETLRLIGARLPVHVLANWDKGLDGVLRQAGLRDLVGDAAASEILGVEKPDRACFEAFLARNRLDPTRVVYVGNEYIADVVGARSAGLMPVLVDRNDRFPAADCLRVRTLRELIPPSKKR